MVIASDRLIAGTRQARLRLHDSTLATLMRWQSEAVAAGRPKPTYSELIDRLVGVFSGQDVASVLALPAEGGG